MCTDQKEQEGMSQGEEAESRDVEGCGTWG